MKVIFVKLSKCIRNSSRGASLSLSGWNGIVSRGIHVVLGNGMIIRGIFLLRVQLWSLGRASPGVAVSSDGLGTLCLGHLLTWLWLLPGLLHQLHSGAASSPPPATALVLTVTFVVDGRYLEVLIGDLVGTLNHHFVAYIRCRSEISGEQMGDRGQGGEEIGILAEVETRVREIKFLNFRALCLCSVQSTSWVLSLYWDDHDWWPE